MEEPAIWGSAACGRADVDSAADAAPCRLRGAKPATRCGPGEQNCRASVPIAQGQRVYWAVLGPWVQLPPTMCSHACTREHVCTRSTRTRAHMHTQHAHTCAHIHTQHAHMHTWIHTAHTYTHIHSLHTHTRMHAQHTHIGAHAYTTYTYTIRTRVHTHSTHVHTQHTRRHPRLLWPVFSTLRFSGGVLVPAGRGARSPGAPVPGERGRPALRLFAGLPPPHGSDSWEAGDVLARRPFVTSLACLTSAAVAFGSAPHRPGRARASGCQVTCVSSA